IGAMPPLKLPGFDVVGGIENRQPPGHSRVLQHVKVLDEQGIESDRGDQVLHGRHEAGVSLHADAVWSAMPEVDPRSKRLEHVSCIGTHIVVYRSNPGLLHQTFCRSWCRSGAIRKEMDFNRGTQMTEQMEDADVAAAVWRKR